MQDGIWDAIKRDRGYWAGDLDVTGRVISTVFADTLQIEDTLRGLVPAGTGPAPAVNGIPGYSAQWVTSLYNFYLHSGDKAFLASQRDDLLRILAGMDTTLDSTGLVAWPRRATAWATPWNAMVTGDSTSTPHELPRQMPAFQSTADYCAGGRVMPTILIREPNRL